MDRCAASIPHLDSGVTGVFVADSRSTAHHRIVLAQRGITRGQVLWVDARDTASTYILSALARTPQDLESIAIARAWTAYQHHSLVRHVVRSVTARTRLVVVPNVCSLYRDDDVDRDEGNWLLTSCLTMLRELAEAADIAVLLTAHPDERGSLEGTLDHELSWMQTPSGEQAVSADTPEMYQGPWWWQTTIPYWVDLLGEAALDAVVSTNRTRPGVSAQTALTKGESGGTFMELAES